MPAYEESVVRPGGQPLTTKEPEPLEDEVREELAQLIIDKIPLDTAVEEASREWSEKEWEQVIKMPAFRRLCLEKALEQSDVELVEEAKKYGGVPKVEEILNRKLTVFGSL